APLAGRPPEYVDRGAREVAVDSPGQPLRPGAILGEELRADVAAFAAVVRLVGRPVLRQRRGVDETGAVCAAGQLRAGGQGVKEAAGGTEAPCGGAAEGARDD